MEINQNVNQTLFNNFSQKIIEFLENKDNCEKIIVNIKNMQRAFPIMDKDEQENIWKNLNDLIKSLPKEYLDSEFWIQLVFNSYQLEKKNINN